MVIFKLEKLITLQTIMAWLHCKQVWPLTPKRKLFPLLNLQFVPQRFQHEFICDANILFWKSRSTWLFHERGLVNNHIRAMKYPKRCGLYGNRLAVRYYFNVKVRLPVSKLRYDVRPCI